jgi:hypothetical protein
LLFLLLCRTAGCHELAVGSLTKECNVSKVVHGFLDPKNEYGNWQQSMRGTCNTNGTAVKSQKRLEQKKKKSMPSENCHVMITSSMIINATFLNYKLLQRGHFQEKTRLNSSLSLTIEIANEDEVTMATQSLPLCILFSGISGLLRVVATMVLAYPDFLQKKQGTSAGARATSKSLYLAAHLFILAVAAVLSIIGTIYGPVSIAIPVKTGACLLFNVIAMCQLYSKCEHLTKVARSRNLRGLFLYLLSH